MRDLALSIDGSAAGFPALDEVAQTLAALDLHSWIPGRTFAPPPPTEVRESLPTARCVATRHVFAAAVDADVDRSGRGLTVAPDSRQPAELAQLLGTVRNARELRAAWVLVDLAAPPQRAGARDAAHTPLLDRLCRSLHESMRREPDVGLALVTPAEAGELPWPDLLSLVFEDLGARRRVGYWHDCGRARVVARAGRLREQEWLARLGPRCVGVDLTDSLGDVAGLPAGAGEVDFAGIREAVARTTLLSLRSEPFVGGAPFAAALRHLRRLGF